MAIKEYSHLQLRKQIQILLRKRHLQNHDPIHAVPQLLVNRRPGLLIRRPRRPQACLEILDLIVVGRILIE